MKLGLFADAVAEQEGAPDAPVLIYRVTERPVVHEAKIAGNDALSKDDLKDTVSLKALAVYDPAQMGKDVKAIQKKYVEKGYFLADVAPRVTALPDNQVDVVYQVNEHAKVQVKEVRFVGNDHVPKEDITPFMQTQEGGLLSFMGSTGTFKEDAFTADIQAVQGVYLERGYVEVRVGKPSVQLSPDRRDLFISIPVEEGAQYDIGEVRFGGELLGQQERLQKLTRIHTGDRFVRSQVGAELTAIQDLYKDLGYAYVNVSPLTATHPVERRVDLTFEVQPGGQFRFAHIEVVGNEKTRDKVIRRELRIYEGELFSGTGLRKSKTNITALGFFETVEITTKKVSDGEVDALVEVKERATGSFQLGAGFSSSENFILTGQISQNNFFGWGQTLALQVQYSSTKQLGQISFTEPYFLDTRWTFSVELYASQGEYSSFTRQAVGGSMTWGYELAGLAPWWPYAEHLENVRLFATYTHEQLKVSSTEVVPTALTNGSGTTSSLRLSLQVDRRDNRLTPSSGWFASVGYETAPRLLAPHSLFGNDVNLFNRYSLDLRAYRPLLHGVVGRARAQLGVIRGLDGQQVPISERYYAGGIQSVRGYSSQSISPKELHACVNNDVAQPCEVGVGGLQQLILNLETEFPLVEKAGFRGVVFFDAGNAFRAGSFHDPSVSLSLYKSVGFGFRWFSPLGPLRFEWGIPLDRRKDRFGSYTDPALDFQFTIGNFF
jgi:outer membrane protein insertion porin family